MNQSLRRYIMLALLGLGVAVAGPALAENKCKPSDTDESGQFHIEERDGKKVYVIDSAITVCGKVPRPLVAYVLQARSINYEWESLKQEFLPKIRKYARKVLSTHFLSSSTLLLPEEHLYEHRYASHAPCSLPP